MFCQVKCLLNGLTIFLISTGIRALGSINLTRSAKVRMSMPDFSLEHQCIIVQYSVYIYYIYIVLYSYTLIIFNHWTVDSVDLRSRADCCVMETVQLSPRSVRQFWRAHRSGDADRHPCRVASWPWLIWLIWLIGHYRIYTYHYIYGVEIILDILIDWCFIW